MPAKHISCSAWGTLKNFYHSGLATAAELFLVCLWQIIQMFEPQRVLWLQQIHREIHRIIEVILNISNISGQQNKSEKNLGLLRVSQASETRYQIWRQWRKEGYIKVRGTDFRGKNVGPTIDGQTSIGKDADASEAAYEVESLQLRPFRRCMKADCAFLHWRTVHALFAFDALGRCNCTFSLASTDLIEEWAPMLNWGQWLYDNMGQIDRTNIKRLSSLDLWDELA